MNTQHAASKGCVDTSRSKKSRMASGSFAVLSKNLVNSVSGFAKFATASGAALGTYKKIKDRVYLHAPQSVKDQQEVWEESAWSTHICQHKNLWVDKELSTEVSQKELAEFIHYKQDFWRVAHWGLALPLVGGWVLPLYAVWFGNDTWVPSTFNANAEQLTAWRHAQDLVRYKYAANVIHATRWFPEMHVKVQEPQPGMWDDLFEKNDVRRDPKFARGVAAGYDKILPYYTARRKHLMQIARAMGIPTFPSGSKVCLGKRIGDYWDLVWNEDYMVIKQGLVEKFSDEELQDYAWRRFLAPYDKNLTREQVLERVGDYHAFLGPKFVEDGATPNLFVCATWCIGYYNEPAYLEGDISELDGDDFTHMAHIGKDAFMRRLEFENGPLRDQVEAHSFKKIAERQKLINES